MAALLFAAAAGAQQTPAPLWRIPTQGGITSAYRTPPVAPVHMENSRRLDSLLRDGRITLSLEDAISLALENNLDLELVRYAPRLAETDVLRAEAGSLLRGIPLSVREGPAGLGAPAAGPNGTLGGGNTPGLNALTGPGVQTDLSIIGSLPLSTGPAVPSFDPAIVGSIGWNHTSDPQNSTFLSNLRSLNASTTAGNVGLQQGFSTGGSFQFGWNTLRQRVNNPLLNLNPAISFEPRADVHPAPAARIRTGGQQTIHQDRQEQSASRRLRFSAAGDRHRVRRRAAVLGPGQPERRCTGPPGGSCQRRAISLRQQKPDRDRNCGAGGRHAGAGRTVAAQARSRCRQEPRPSGGGDGKGLPDAIDPRFRPDQRSHRSDGPYGDSAAGAVEPLNDLVTKALRIRPDVAQARLQITNSEISLQGSKNALRPGLDLVASAQNNGLAGRPNGFALNPGNPLVGGAGGDGFLVGGYGDAMSQLFSRNFPDYGVGLQLTIPLRNRTARADVVRDQLSVREQQIRLQQLEKQVRLEVTNALIAVEQARESYEAAQSERVLQEQVLSAEREKLEVGASTTLLRGSIPARPGRRAIGRDLRSGQLSEGQDGTAKIRRNYPGRLFHRDGRSRPRRSEPQRQGVKM